MPPRLDPTLTELSLERLRRRRSAKWSRYGPDVLPAWVAEMDFPLAPPLKRALQEAIELDDCGYGNPEELGAAFAEFAASRHGWEVDPGAVSPSSDVVGALTAVLKEIAEPGDRVVIDTPVYHPFFAVVEEAGCELVEVPLAGTELDVEGIERAFAAGAAALILCSPHNPAGSVPSRVQWGRSPRPPSGTGPGFSPMRSTRRWCCPAPSTSPFSPSPRRLGGGASPFGRPLRRSTSPGCSAPRSSPPRRRRRGSSPGCR